MWYDDPTCLIALIFGSTGVFFWALAYWAFKREYKLLSISLAAVFGMCIGLGAFALMFDWLILHHEEVFTWIGTTLS